VAAAKPAAARVERHGFPIRLAVHQLGREDRVNAAASAGIRAAAWIRRKGVSRRQFLNTGLQASPHVPDTCLASRARQQWTLS
jgi:hypothetical protein